MEHYFCFVFLAPEKYGAVTKSAAVVLVVQDPTAEINSVKGKGGVLSGGGETKIFFCIPSTVSVRRSPLRVSYIVQAACDSLLKSTRPGHKKRKQRTHVVQGTYHRQPLETERQQRANPVSCSDRSRRLTGSTRPRLCNTPGTALKSSKNASLFTLRPDGSDMLSA